MKDSRASLHGLNEAQQRIRREKEARQKMANALARKPVKVTQYRNGRSIMRFPLFTTKYANTKTGRQEEGIQYTDPVNGIYFEISPKSRFGMPDQVDGNIIRLVISKAREIHHTLDICPSVIYVKRYELAGELGLTVSGKGYQNLHRRLHRIAGIHCAGNIFYKEKIFSGPLITFSWPNNEDPEGVIKIKLEPDFKDYLDQEKSVLAIPEENLHLQSPLEIRLRELVQIHMGKEKRTWSIGFPRLVKLCQTKSPLKELKRTLKDFSLPYFIDFKGGRKLTDQIVTFTVKERQPNSIAPIIDAIAQTSSLW